MGVPKMKIQRYVHACSRAVYMYTLLLKVTKQLTCMRCSCCTSNQFCFAHTRVLLF